MLGKIISSLTKTGLLKKFIAGYILIIMVPSALLGIFIYREFYDNMVDEHIKQKQQILDKYYSSMANDLVKIQGIYGLFQFNTNVIDYLEGNYASDVDSVYTYIKFIKPIYNYVYSSMPLIEDMKIYKSNGSVLSIPSTIINIALLDDAKIINDITSVNGIWNYKQIHDGDLPVIKFYQKIYNNDFYKGIGILEIRPNTEVLTNYINNIKSLSTGYDSIYLTDEENNVLFKTGELRFQENEENLKELLQNNLPGRYFHTEIDGRKLTGYTINIKELNMKTVVLEDRDSKPEYLRLNTVSIFLYIIVLVIVLSTIYYFIASNITTRVTKLAKHMRKVDEKNIYLYAGKSGKDEIGFLIDSYNSMLRRIDELVNTVHKEELLRKEAAYAALQAQIRPHFLFGTLEVIRMLAESNKDTEVANIVFTFGRLMRYSLFSSKKEVLLQEEIENVKNYLQIQKIRMGDRLRYEILVYTKDNSFYCPRFILQPLVENSVVHGISKSRRQGLISISVTSDDDYIIIRVYDNGNGILPERMSVIQDVIDNKIEINDFQTDNSGFGIYNVSERIKAYYGHNSRMVLTSTLNRGTTCTLYLYRNKGDGNNENNDCG